jgi:5-methyltetrahydropteroyltriglutamate--homocysteine methyltransferase
MRAGIFKTYGIDLEILWSSGGGETMQAVISGRVDIGGDWLSYVDDRFDGFEARPPAGGKPIILQGKDREVFANFYRYATERGTLFYEPAGQIKQSRPHWVATGPISYRGETGLKREIEILRNVVGPDTEAFVTTTAPASLEPYRRNEYYRSAEEFVFALAEAMRSEYQAIVAGGFILQIDDAWLPALWDRIGMEMGLPAFRKYCEVRIEALNHAPRNLPEDRIRYHLCWGSWHGPHAFDIELDKLVDLMLRVRAQGYLIEAANARHEHEYAIWKHVKLPEGKIACAGPSGNHHDEWEPAYRGVSRDPPLRLDGRVANACFKAKCRPYYRQHRRHQS